MTEEYTNPGNDGYIIGHIEVNTSNNQRFAVWEKRIDGKPGYAVVVNGEWAHMDGECPFSLGG